jgi:putative transposase
MIYGLSVARPRCVELKLGLRLYGDVYHQVLVEGTNRLHTAGMRVYHGVHVQLTKKDREQIGGMLNKGWESARVLRRALILRQLDQGQTAEQVAGQVGVASKTVRAIARRYEDEGLESALYERPRPGQQRRLDAGQSQRIIAMVCGPPPQGQARWNVRLIAREAVKRKLVPRVGRETIRILLQSHDLKPWREKNVVRGGTG